MVTAGTSGRAQEKPGWQDWGHRWGLRVSNERSSAFIFSIRESPEPGWMLATWVPSTEPHPTPSCCGDHVEGSTVCGHYQTHQRPPQRLHEPCATQRGTHSDLLGTHWGISPASQYTRPPSAWGSAPFAKKKKKPLTWLVFPQLSSQAGGHWAGTCLPASLHDQTSQITRQRPQHRRQTHGRRA